MEERALNTLHSSEVNLNDATPMMQQFLEIKKEHQDVILLYRMGDFYETFFEDALTIAKDLEITLTAREGGNLGKIPMAGVPVKAIDGYIAKLLEKNHKIAICEQTEDPAQAKGLVKRSVVRKITAGTITESNLLDSTKNNYLAAVLKSENSEFYGFAYVDVTTGEFKVTQIDFESLLSELSRISPSEIIAPTKKVEIKPFQIVPEAVADLPKRIRENYNCTNVNKEFFNEISAIEKIKEIFKVKSIEGFGYPDYALGIMAAGAILEYLTETQMDSIPRFERIIPYSLHSYVSMDVNTRRNLELTETLRDKTSKGSLFWAINKTNTSMGARLLKKWIQQPLQDLGLIKFRQAAVEELILSSQVRLELASILERVYDIERLSTKVSNNSANARDLLSLKDSLLMLPYFKKLLEGSKSQYLNILAKEREGISDFCEILDKTLAECPPIGIKEGNIIKQGVNAELDYQRSLLTGGKEWLEKFENDEKERSGIRSLKVGYSKTFGYFIEVTHANAGSVPSNYIRRQTLTNAERYITDELKKHETEVLSAQTKSIDLEYSLFCNLREYAKEFVPILRELAEAVSTLDVLLSFSLTAVENNYSKPEVDNSNDLTIIEGRHPVIEKILSMGQYVANDLKIKAGDKLDKEDTEFMILTGPNMAGKSTYMRQNALMVILAQIGSFVPARAAKIGIVDKIFTRVGAVDDLTTGQSTFMMEMTETALILNSATERSFILLDEIGRGTSTYDGVAIAWSVAEYIVDKIKARTIFATHYHELNVMCNVHPQIKNYRITVSENEGEIEFLRQVVPGGTSKSYGIHVAKMAGLPMGVIHRAENLMSKMQRNYASDLSTGKKKKDVIEINSPQLSLFEE